MSFYRIRKIVVLILLGSACFLLGATTQKAKNPVTRKILSQGEVLIGIPFTDAEKDLMREDVGDRLKNYDALRKIPLANDVSPSLMFNPLPLGFQPPQGESLFRAALPGRVVRPSNLEDVAFYSISELAELIRTRQVSSEELTAVYLNRLKKYGPRLECVVTLTEELAMKEARRADQEIQSGLYRGLLHGIPYVAKDLLAVKGYKTTWGSVPYKDQVIDSDAGVILKLREAGAVLLAKTTVGELAWGDIWYGGTTRNPWNYKQGSSGSSAGTASATAAGLAPFGIGTETWGSIISPATRCGITGLRPTYGRVTRNGAMALSWSMDKVGPICRNAEDCAIVLDAIFGPDGKDPSVYDFPFRYQPEIDIRKLRIGYLKADFDSQMEDAKRKTDDELDISRANDHAALAKLQELGAVLKPLELPKIPVNDIGFILDSEAAASFDELTRSGKDDQLRKQEDNAWPNVFRAARFIPAVEYIQANRARTLLIQQMDEALRDLDLYVAPSFDGDNLLLTNLTGHPCICVPNGFTPAGNPTSITFCGKLFDEGTILAFARSYQQATEHHRKHPTLQQ